MMIFILTKKDQVNICEHLASLIRESFRPVTVFTDAEEFWTAIQLAKPGEVEYVMIDCRTFMIDLFNPYEMMKKTDNPVPIVVYNDPYPDSDSRAAFWLRKNKDYFVPKFMDVSRVDQLQHAFVVLQAHLRNQKLNKFFAVARDFEPFLSKEEQLLLIDTEDFRRKNKLSPARFKLFMKFYENLNVSFSEEDLCSLFWDDFSQKRVQTLYTYIHDLRIACKREEQVTILIERQCKGCYCMRIFLDQNQKKAAGIV
ncbi:MAG: helix-turn-helix domain-containing protein [Treponema sp.]|nr:helix-turn-helix domain-containing protein [Treponema sp.]